MRPPRPSVLARLQRGLESLYRVETNLEVDAFLVDDDAREAALGGQEDIGGGEGTGRRPKEQLLVSHDADELQLALYVADDVIANLESRDPAAGLDDGNFGDFCLAVEGVSHFVYVALCARAERPVSALELELQAEVDKYVSCLFVLDAGPELAAVLRRQLFDHVSFAPDLDGAERERYVTANAEARRYAASLERRYLLPGRTPDMLRELRRFYRLGWDGKRGLIAQAA